MLVLLALPFKPSRAPFGPSVRDVAVRHICCSLFRLRSASLALPASCLLYPLLTSALCSANLAAHSVPTTGQQRRPPEVSLTAFTTHPPDLPPHLLMAMDFAITCSLVQAGRPHIWFLFVRSWLCSALPSDPASRRRPCASLILHHHQVGSRTCTSKLSNMLGTQAKSREKRLFAEFRIALACIRNDRN